MTEANECVKRDDAPGGRMECSENVPERYKVSKESELDRVGDGKDDSSGVDVGHDE